MKNYLHFKAGTAIINMIRQEGLKPVRVRVLIGPAGGPKWFVSVGFDKALMKTRFLENNGQRILLAGSSAGAWRCIAMACKDPLDAYEKLRIAYSRNVFTPLDTPATIGKALRNNVQSFLRDEDVPFILKHPIFDLAVHCVRGRGMGGSEYRRFQGAALLFGAVLNAVSRTGMAVFFERVVFFSGPREPLFLRHSFKGESVRLNAENIRMVAVATGSLPYIISGVKNIPGSPEGVYRDGGLLDYQINQDYCPGDDRVALFFNYQERIVPGWFDKKLFWRRPPGEALARVLQVYPGEEFVKLLPGCRIPDRNDFKAFVNDPAERIRRWDEVSRLSEILGEEFMETVESGRISRLVRPLR
ncbi:MAG: hypothetical protein WCJ75_02495 [Desulfomonile sp.]